MAVRSLTGAAYVALTLGAAWVGGWAILLLFLPVCAVAAREMHRLLWASGEGPSPFWSVALAVVAHLALGLTALHAAWTAPHALAACFLLLLVAIAVLLARGARDPARGTGGLLLLMLLVGVPFGALPHLHAHGTWVFIGFMVLLWTNDTGAYLSGRSLGRTKLLPMVSPNKTVEGLAGGVALTLGMAAVLARSQPVLDLSGWLACGAIVALTATLGDLLESALKRARGVKDSGTLLPGHGGVLDRFDGMLLAAPAVLLWLLLTR